MRHSTATPAIVLRRVAYGEADLVVTLLGLGVGRVSALARGARKSTRRFSGGLDMGMVGEACLVDRPNADLMVLESFDGRVDRPNFSGDLAKTAHAAYALELCDRLCPPRQPEESAFRWLEEFLIRLHAGQATAERLRVFELGLLRILGMGPSIDRCAACGRTDLGEEDVRFLAHAGGVLCRHCAKAGDLMTGKTRGVLGMLARTSLAEADTIVLERNLGAACRKAVLALLHEHLHGPLRSLDFMEKMSSSR